MCMSNGSCVCKLHQNVVLQEEEDLDLDVNLLFNHVDPLQAANQCVRRSSCVRRAPTHVNDYQL